MTERTRTAIHPALVILALGAAAIVVACALFDPRAALLAVGVLTVAGAADWLRS